MHMGTYKTIVIVGFSTCFLGVRGSGELSVAGTEPPGESSRKGLLGESRSGKPGRIIRFFSFCLALWVVGGGVASRGTIAGALREGGGENKPVWPRRRRWGAGGGEDEGERVRERARVVTPLLEGLSFDLELLDGTTVEDEALLSLNQNCSSARASLSSSAIASRVMVLRLLLPTATPPSFRTSLRRLSSLSDSGSGTS